MKRTRPDTPTTGAQIERWEQDQDERRYDDDAADRVQNRYERWLAQENR